MIIRSHYAAQSQHRCRDCGRRSVWPLAQSAPRIAHVRGAPAMIESLCTHQLGLTTSNNGS
jgi:hypothetical protein